MNKPEFSLTEIMAPLVGFSLAEGDILNAVHMTELTAKGVLDLSLDGHIADIKGEVGRLRVLQHVVHEAEENLIRRPPKNREGSLLVIKFPARS